MARVCLDCPTIIQSGTRCPTCTRARDKARGTREARGYDHTHRTLRTHYQHRLEQGETFTCQWCLDPVTAHDTWDLGHNEDRTHAGPEHASCNRATNRRASHT